MRIKQIKQMVTGNPFIPKKSYQSYNPANHGSKERYTTSPNTHPTLPLPAGRPALIELTHFFLFGLSGKMD